MWKFMQHAGEQKGGGSRGKAAGQGAQLRWGLGTLGWFWPLIIWAYERCLVRRDARTNCDMEAAQDLKLLRRALAPKCGSHTLPLLSSPSLYVSLSYANDRSDRHRPKAKVPWRPHRSDVVVVVSNCNCGVFIIIAARWPRAFCQPTPPFLVPHNQPAPGSLK